jgi:hypothetical protein
MMTATTTKTATTTTTLVRARRNSFRARATSWAATSTTQSLASFSPTRRAQASSSSPPAPRTCRGVAWHGVGVVWRGVCGVMWRAMAWRVVSWRGMAWRGLDVRGMAKSRLLNAIVLGCFGCFVSLPTDPAARRRSALAVLPLDRDDNMALAHFFDVAIAEVLMHVYKTSFRRLRERQDAEELWTAFLQRNAVPEQPVEDARDPRWGEMLVVARKTSVLHVRAQHQRRNAGWPSRLPSLRPQDHDDRLILLLSLASLYRSSRRPPSTCRKSCRTSR